MSTILQQLSGALTEATKAASKYVVAVSGGARFGASGVIWQPGAVVTTRSTIRRDDKLRVTLPNGETAAATLAGHDSGTDIAVLTFEGSTTDAPLARASNSQPGEVVLAVGRSDNTGVNAAFGLVSAVGKGWQTWQGGKIDAYLRLDLTLYSGRLRSSGYQYKWRTRRHSKRSPVAHRASRDSVCDNRARCSPASQTRHNP